MQYTPSHSAVVSESSCLCSVTIVWSSAASPIEALNTEAAIAQHAAPGEMGMAIRLRTAPVELSWGCTRYSTYKANTAANRVSVLALQRNSAPTPKIIFFPLGSSSHSLQTNRAFPLVLGTRRHPVLCDTCTQGQNSGATIPPSKMNENLSSLQAVTKSPNLQPPACTKVLGTAAQTQLAKPVRICSQAFACRLRHWLALHLSYCRTMQMELLTCR